MKKSQKKSGLKKKIQHPKKAPISKLGLRVGLGTDVHPFTEGRPLILGGVEIAHSHGLQGHSDADVLIHAVMDALLGAAGLGDIGLHFPNHDSQYRGISSLVLLKKVQGMITKKGFCIENIDATLVIEVPKIAPFIPEMQKNMAQVLDISLDRMNIKATRSEGLGFIGRAEGVVAQAICLLKEGS